MKQTGMNMEAVKRQNRTSILKLINQKGPISRKDIASELGLTPAAVTLICSEFLEQGVLLEKGILEEKARAGRKKVLLDINYEYRYVIGINIEQEHTYLVVSNLCGDVQKKTTIHTAVEKEPQIFLADVAQAVKKLIRQTELPMERIAGVGVCVPGIVDKESGKAVRAYGIWKEEVELCDFLQEKLNLPVCIENNVNAFAKAELLCGAGKERGNLLLVKWGPGVGSSIVIDNHIYEGRHGKAAELGHFIVEKEGELCSCGRRGCLETKVSLSALQRDIKGLTQDNLGSYLRNGTKEEQEIVWNAIDLFAQTIVNSVTILAPNRVILFGKLFRAKAVRDAFIACCGNYASDYGNRILYSELAEKEDYIGAVAIFILEHLFQ